MFPYDLKHIQDLLAELMTHVAGLQVYVGWNGNHEVSGGQRQPMIGYIAQQGQLLPHQGVTPVTVLPSELASTLRDNLGLGKLNDPMIHSLLQAIEQAPVT